MSVRVESWPRPHRLTVDEYYRMAEVGLLSPDDRVELIEGEIVDMPPAGSAHASVVSVLAELLITAVGDTAGVRIQSSIRLDDRSEPEPDVAVVKRRADSYRRAHPTAADVLLLIEVSESTLRFDLTRKAKLYAKHGIVEYWVVDLVDNRVHCHRRPGNERYTEVSVATTGVLRCSSIAVAVPVARLF